MARRALSAWGMALMLVATGVTTLLGAGAMAGCARDAGEVAVEHSFEADLVALKDPGSPITEQVKEKIGGLESYGIDLDAFVADWLGTIEYMIGDVTIEGDTASLSAVIECRQLGPAVDRFANEVGEFISDPAIGEKSQAEVHDGIAKLFNQSMAGEQPASLSVVLDYILRGGEWMKAASWDETVVSALIGPSEILNPPPN
jgi:hypothetical protein